MLSHDASLRKSEAASSKVAFSTSINWGRKRGHISQLQTAFRQRDDSETYLPIHVACLHVIQTNGSVVKTATEVMQSEDPQTSLVKSHLTA